MTVNSERRAAFKECVIGENNQDEATFRFIMEFIEVDQDSLTMIKDNWAALEKSEGIISAMLKIDADNGLRMFFHKLLPSAQSSVISLLTLTLATLGLSGLGSGIDAGIACLPKLLE